MIWIFKSGIEIEITDSFSLALLLSAKYRLITLAFKVLAFKNLFLIFLSDVLTDNFLINLIVQLRRLFVMQRNVLMSV